MSQPRVAGSAAFKPRTLMKSLLAAAVLPALLVSSAAMAQVDGQFDGTVTPTPMIGATSPLGVAMGGSGSPTGIPLGSTEITSPGVSPLPTGATGTITIATTTTSTACPTVATSRSEMFGSTASFDGGGMGDGSCGARHRGEFGHHGGRHRPTSTMSATSLTSELPVTSGSPGTLDTSGTSGMCGSRLEQPCGIVRGQPRPRPPRRAAPLAPESRSDHSRSPISAWFDTASAAAERVAHGEPCRGWVRWRQRRPPCHRRPCPRRRQAIRRARVRHDPRDRKFRRRRQRRDVRHVGHGAVVRQFRICQR